MIYEPVPFSKICRVCKQNTFYAYLTKDKKSKDGAQALCKKCNTKHARQWEINNPERKREQNRRKREKNPERHREVNRESRRRRDSVKHEDYLRACRKYYKTHAEDRKEYSRQYRVTHPDYAENQRNKRRMRKRGLPHNFKKADWVRCLSYWNYRCAVCGRPAGFWHTIAQDHWIPVTDPRPDNPGTVPWNIVPLCHAKKDGGSACNNKKYTRDPIEWLTEEYGANKARRIVARIKAYFEWVRQFA